MPTRTRSPARRVQPHQEPPRAADKRSGWQLSGDAPEAWERYLVPACVQPWAEDLVRRAGLRPGAWSSTSSDRFMRAGDAIVGDLERAMLPHLDDHGVVFPCECYVLEASK